MHSNDLEFSMTADLREHILSELPCGLCVARQDERLSVVFANSNFYRILGYESEDSAAQSERIGALDCLEEPARAEILARMQSMRASDEQTVALEARFQTGGRLVVLTTQRFDFGLRLGHALQRGLALGVGDDLVALGADGGRHHRLAHIARCTDRAGHQPTPLLLFEVGRGSEPCFEYMAVTAAQVEYDHRVPGPTFAAASGRA